jgi:streptogramin lyase
LLAAALTAACSAAPAPSGSSPIDQPAVLRGGLGAPTTGGASLQNRATTGGTSGGGTPATPAPGAAPRKPATLLATVSVGQNPRGLALDLQGRLWVALAGTGAIARIDGIAIAQQISAPGAEDLAFDAGGRAWVAAGGGLFGFDASGSPLQGAAGSAAEAVVASGEFVYATFPKEGAIRRYSVTKAGLTGALTLPGSSGTPRDLLMDRSGRLWAALGEANQVARYDNPAATPSAPVLIPVAGGEPRGLAQEGSGRVLSIGNSSVVAVSDATPKVLVQNSLLAGAFRLAPDLSGTLWAPANGANRLVGIKTDGTLLPDPPAGLAAPWDAVVDRSGDVWVSNDAGGTVMRFKGS